MARRVWRFGRLCHCRIRVSVQEKVHAPSEMASRVIRCGLRGLGHVRRYSPHTFRVVVGHGGTVCHHEVSGGRSARVIPMST